MSLNFTNIKLSLRASQTQAYQAEIWKEVKS